MLFLISFLDRSKPQSSHIMREAKATLVSPMWSSRLSTWRDGVTAVKEQIGWMPSNTWEIALEPCALDEELCQADKTKPKKQQQQRTTQNRTRPNKIEAKTWQPHTKCKNIKWRNWCQDEKSWVRRARGTWIDSGHPQCRRFSGLVRVHTRTHTHTHVA